MTDDHVNIYAKPLQSLRNLFCLSVGVAIRVMIQPDLADPARAKPSSRPILPGDGAIRIDAQ
jgi:hypothetical protein